MDDIERRVAARRALEVVDLALLIAFEEARAVQYASGSPQMARLRRLERHRADVLCEIRDLFDHQGAA